MASITILPAPVTVNVLPLIVPVPVLDPSIVNTTGFPEAPPVATRGIISPDENVCGDIGDVNVIAWAIRSEIPAPLTANVTAGHGPPPPLLEIEILAVPL